MIDLDLLSALGVWAESGNVSKMEIDKHGKGVKISLHSPETDMPLVMYETPRLCMDDALQVLVDKARLANYSYQELNRMRTWPATLPSASWQAPRTRGLGALEHLDQYLHLSQDEEGNWRLWNGVGTVLADIHHEEDGSWRFERRGTVASQSEDEGPCVHPYRWVTGGVCQCGAQMEE